MRAPLAPWIIVLSVIGLCALSPQTSFSHGVMTTPESRAVGSENEDYQFCFGTPDCVCGDFPEAGAVVATYQAGQTISVTIDITRTHTEDPTFRFQLCPPDQLSQSCFVEGEFATALFDGFGGLHTYEITLPEDVVCDPCVLRWKWDYSFLSCADVRIVGVDVKAEGESWTSLKATFR